jgi:metal-responsive CopG/Arc/MetJ family transcriptional regulator
MKMKITTFKLDEDTLKQVEEYCLMNGINKSELMRRAIVFYLAKEKEKSKPAPRVKIVEVV